MPPGSLGSLQLVVPDLVAARGAPRARSGGHRGRQVYSEEGLRPRREGESLDKVVGCIYFDDPEGNGFTVQQISSRD
jgi:hypothetical protein